MATDLENQVPMDDDKDEQVKDQDEEKSDDSVDDAQKSDDEELEVKLEDGGIIKKIITKGSGWEKPPAGADCQVHYVGTLEDGTKFDSSRDRGEPFQFKLGQGSVIKAWDKGVATMKKGEKALLICKPEFAYGSAGSPPKIPPNATLHFEVELLSFTSLEKVTDDGGVMKKVLEAGDGWKTPKEMGKANVKIVGKLKDGSVFYRHEGELDVSDPSLAWGLSEGLLKAKKGSKLLLFVQPEYGYGETGNKQLGVPPNAELEYEVFVADFTNPKDSWDMSKQEKVDHGVRMKENGNALFKQTQYKRAKKVYESVAKLFEYDKDLEPAIQAAVDKLKLEAHANAAACAYHSKDWADTIKDCNAALKLDSTHTKSLFRRAQAHGQNGDNDDALRDLQHLREVISLKEEKGEPIGVDKAAVDKFAQSVKARIAHLEKKQRKLFGGFFSKLSLVSEDEVKKSQAQAKPIEEDSSDDESAPKTDSATSASAVESTAQEPAPQSVEISETKPEAAKPPSQSSAPEESEGAKPAPQEDNQDAKAGKAKKVTKAGKPASKKETGSKKTVDATQTTEEPKSEAKKAEPKAKGKVEAKGKAGKGKDTKTETEVEKPADKPVENPVPQPETKQVEPEVKAESQPEAKVETEKPEAKSKTPKKVTKTPAKQAAAKTEPKTEPAVVEPVEAPKAAKPEAAPKTEPAAAAPKAEVEKAAVQSPEKKADKAGEKTKTPAKRKK